MLRYLLRVTPAFSLTLFVSSLVSHVQACSLCEDAAEATFVGASAPVSVASAPAPALSSRPGAPYTVYLNFDGFTYSGNWAGRPPGTVPAYTGTSAQLTEAWARVAEKYAAFDVNVTTVDPSGFAPTDYLSRQNYYDTTARVMQTIIGGNNAWYNAGAGGVSYVDVFRDAHAAGSGYHTNWAFPLNLRNNQPKAVAEAVTHEAGHGFGLWHQTDYNLNPGNSYSTNGGATGDGSYAPQMGTTYNSQRGTWRVGTFGGGGGAFQNDVATILSNPGLSLAGSGGNTFDTATALPLTGSLLDSVGGVIVPLSESAPNPIGIENYSRDFFRFSLAAPGDVTLNLANGGDWITPGVAAPGATLRSRLNLYRADNRATPFAFGLEATDTMSSTFSAMLGAGDYFAEITSFGGYASTYDTTAKYFDMGSYTLRGAIIPVVVPEGGTFVLLGAGVAAFVVLRRRTGNRDARSGITCS
ncbi:MAG: PEP-CTERM sorting domain-containing protein [Armatimonadetes bacterium]|nr:PEP-CTERM sorting domain-containing protein [Armatimonadota bacterium]